MMQLVAIAGGGAVGALMRFWLAGWVYNLLGRDFPWGTLVVNVLGSLVMGLLYVLFIERFNAAPEWRALLLVGFLGAFTTFSTFSLETLTLLEDGQLLRAGLNVMLSVGLCITAAWLGMIAGRQI